MQTNLISIITCTYNPSHEVFLRVINAINLLDRTGIEVEYIIVDNNSAQPVSKISYMKEFLANNPWAKVVTENEPGLTAARICGYKNSKGLILLFVDDDVELDCNYLQEMLKLFNEINQVGAWNAGRIEVDYLTRPKQWFLAEGRIYYQFSDIKGTVWGRGNGPATDVPFGTGLCLRRDVFEYYCIKVQNKEFKLTDRIGNLLISCGDSQIVYCTLLMNFDIGRSSLLKLNHLVSSQKATFSYLIRQKFGIDYSTRFFLNETIPELYMEISVYTFCKSVIHNTIHLIPKFDFKDYRLKVAGILGSLYADRRIKGKAIPFWLKMISIIYNIKTKGF